jgi:hypothetical protein
MINEDVRACIAKYRFRGGFYVLQILSGRRNYPDKQGFRIEEDMGLLSCLEDYKL